LESRAAWFLTSVTKFHQDRQNSIFASDKYEMRRQIKLKQLSSEFQQAQADLKNLYYSDLESIEAKHSM
jgi:hypothetical protein